VSEKTSEREAELTRGRYKIDISSNVADAQNGDIVMKYCFSVADTHSTEWGYCDEVLLQRRRRTEWGYCDGV